VLNKVLENRLMSLYTLHKTTAMQEVRAPSVAPCCSYCSGGHGLLQSNLCSWVYYCLTQSVLKSVQHPKPTTLAAIMLHGRLQQCSPCCLCQPSWIYQLVVRA